MGRRRGAWRRPGPRAIGLLAIGAIGLAAGTVGIRTGLLTNGTGQGAAGTAPRFVDVTASAGLEHRYDGGFPYAVGGGVAAFDCNGDGRPELYLAGGEQQAALYRNDSAPGGIRLTPLPDRLTDVTGVNGAYALDVDGDGAVDLMLLRNGENVALRGLGDCRFERANEAWGLDGGADQTEAFSATWEAGADWPTIAFGNYVAPGSLDPATWCQASRLVRPAASTGGPTKKFGAPYALMPSFCALSILFSDWDGSGRRDLRMSNDREYYPDDVGQEQLWRVVPGAAPRLYTAAEGWARVQVQGMGIASYDVDADARPEVYLTSQSASRLQTLAQGAAAGAPAYIDIGLPRGVNVAHPFTGSDMDLPSTAWHPEFADVNDDGYVDLLVTKGNVTEQPDYAMQDPTNLLLGQPDGTFIEAADVAGILTFDRGRGAALVDLDLDGRLDLVESFYAAPVRVWRNSGPADGAAAERGHWLALRLVQPGANVDAIGAWIEVRTGDVTRRRELMVGGGHAGGQLGWIHVGLGPATTAEVRVRWPDGTVGPWQPIDVDAFSVVDRDAGAAVRWQPPAP